MNILTDKLPDGITIDGYDYPIHTDFRVWIKFELIMLGGKVSPEQKAVMLLSMYRGKLPISSDKAIKAIIEFYAGTKEDKRGSEGKNNKSPIYSFEHDADYIYAAFISQYGIDLQTADLHWLQFRALFKSLNDTNQIMKIMEYRSIDLNEIKDKEQKKFYRKMKKLYALPDERTEEEKERDMINSLSKLF